MKQYGECISLSRQHYFEKYNTFFRRLERYYCAFCGVDIPESAYKVLDDRQVTLDAIANFKKGLGL